MARKTKLTVKVYPGKEGFTALAAHAEAAGFRRGGLLLYTQKKDGFAHEKVANTDGIAQYLKWCGLIFFPEHKAEWLKEQAEIIAQRQQLEEREKRIAPFLTKQKKVVL